MAALTYRVFQDRSGSKRERALDVLDCSGDRPSVAKAIADRKGEELDRLQRKPRRETGASDVVDAVRRDYSVAVAYASQFQMSR